MDYCSYLGSLSNIDVTCKMTDGYESLGYIIPRSYIDFASIKYGYSDPSTSEVVWPKTVVTSLAAKSGKKGYYIKQLKDAFSDTAVALNAGDYKNSFTNTVAFKIFGNGPEIAKIVNGLANDEFVVVLEQKEKGTNGESQYRIFGLDGGLSATATDNNAYDESIGNGWSVTLEETTATSSAYYLFVSDGSSEPSQSATEACVTSLFDQPA